MLDRSTSSWYSLSDQVEDVNGLKPYNEQRSLLFKDGVPTSFCFGQVNLHHLKGRKEWLFKNYWLFAVEFGRANNDCSQSSDTERKSLKLRELRYFR